MRLLILLLVLTGCSSEPDYSHSTSYMVKITCTNCNHENRVSVPKGTKQYEFDYSKSKCRYCGCELKSPWNLK